MTDHDDVRDRFDPKEEVPKWFWDMIASGQKDPAFFQQLTDEQLVDFANVMQDIKTYFSHEPFHPPADVFVSEDTLDRAGAWVASQGRDYFNSVWSNPTTFSRVIANHDYLRGSNFEFAASSVWEERHGTDIPTV